MINQSIIEITDTTATAKYSKYWYTRMHFN
jgi:hypothetical protein